MKGRKTIRQSFEVRLAIIIAIAFTATTLFVFLLNTSTNNRNYSDIIFSTLTDIEKDIEDTSDINMLERTRKMRVKVLLLRNALPLNDVEGFNSALRDIEEEEELSEISIVNKKNIIIYSSKEEYIGFDMNANEDTRVYDALNHGLTEIVQPVRANAFKGDGDHALYNKYSGVPIEGMGYLQIGISSDQFQEQIDEKVSYIAANRHIGQTGTVIISNIDGEIVSFAGMDENSYKNISLADLGIPSDQYRITGEAFVSNINGVPHLIGTKFVEGYYIIGAVPMKEVQSNRDHAAILNTIMEVIIFALLFIFIRDMINTKIVSKIHNINGSLKRIIEGELDTRVNEYSTREFAELSNDINSTVDSLKDYMNREQEKIKQELEFAKNIQASALPKISTLEQYAQIFELYATMDTAREVGGDFYDFYMLDESHLAVLIADVSGKGVPAAMFMMTCKTMLKNLVESGMALNEAFDKANEALRDSNDAGMFVTVWMGILDLRTGELEYVNAGHNPPLIYDESGSFAYLRTKAGFVLTGMEGLKYESRKTILRPGDKMLLYTDGVTEANDPDGNLFGEDRLHAYVNSVKEKPMQDILSGIRSGIDAFAKEAEQFDDITMVGLCYRGWNS